MDANTENITVAVRIRPMLPTDNISDTIWDSSNSSVRCLKTDEKFDFDKTYSMNSSTQRIFDEVLESKIWKAIEGWNTSIVCYGQSGSGKTFTICGKKKTPGMIPLTIQTIFSYIEETPSQEFLIRCSYCEISNETINDLLNPLNSNLPLIEDKNV